MSIFQSFLLSVVEGITEFLPISSTGHLILFSRIMGITQNEFTKSFEIFIQLGAILAVVFLYWKKLIRNHDYWKKIIVAFLPTGILGLALYKLIKTYLLGNSLVVIISLFIGGIILIVVEKLYKEKGKQTVEIDTLGYKNAFIIGIFQSLSMIPGVSRAAASIIGGLFMGLRRKEAVEFSFLLAIPTMLAATVLDLVKSNFLFTSGEYFLMTIGFAGAFVTALVTIKYFLSYIEKHNFLAFGIYRIAVAVVFYIIIFK